MAPLNPLKHHNPSLGMMFMLITMASFSFIDAIARLMVMEGMHPIQVSWGRLLLQVIMLSPVVYLMGGRNVLRTKRIGLHALRGGIMFTAAIFFVSGLKFLPIATVTTIGFVSPLFIAVLSILFLGEIVRLRRWVAIILGFVGVAIVIQPGLEGFHWAAIFPLCSSLCWATGVILTRHLQDTDHRMGIIYWSAVFGLIPATVLVPFFWMPYSGYLLALTLVLGIGNTVAQIFFVRALEHAEASLLGPMSYSQIVWSSLYGFFLFGDVVPNSLWYGAAIIILSGLYLWYREQQIARAAMKLAQIDPATAQPGWRQRLGI